MPTPQKYDGARGTTWRVRFRIGRQQFCETFNTKRDADRFCASIYAHGARTAHEILLAEAELEGAPTVADLAEKFFAWKARDPNVRSDRTVADYRRDYANWIQPTFGALPAMAVNEGQVQDWVDAMSAGTLGRKPLQPKSVADRHMILHSIYAWGMEPARKLVTHNPTLSSSLPKRRKKPPKGLRPAEWQALHAALRQIDQDAADFAEFMLASSWRISEAGALSAFEVEDHCACDQDGCDCPIYVAMGRVIRRNAAGQHIIVEDAKSEASERRSRLDPEASRLVRHRLQRVRGNGLVFTTNQGNQWHYSNFLNRYWKPAVKAAGLTRNPTPHWLKHTSVFWLLNTRLTSTAEIQRRAGHVHHSTTIDVYGRMIDDVSDEALAAFAEMRRVSSARQVPSSGTGGELPPRTAG